MLAAARAVHFASAMLLFGGLMFVLAVARPALRFSGGPPSGHGDALYRCLPPIGIWSLAASIVSGAIWLGAEAAGMSGLPFAQAIGRETLGLVLGETAFGRLWLLRFALTLVLGALLLAIRRSADDTRSSRIAMGALLLAAAYLATLAWAGHAGAGQGRDRFIQIVSDAVHLLAAGAWLGALPGLVMLLGEAQPREVAIRAVRRFSLLGLTSVGALVLTGCVNAWYLVGTVPALVGTDYGRLLLAKLALFAVMIVIAAVNRFELTPRLATEDDRALRSLRRNAVLETAAGVAVVAIVGALGITVPGAHTVPVWPFAHTLSLKPVYETVGISTALVFAASVALVAAGMALQGFRTRRSALWVSGLAAISIAVSSSAWLLAVPAYPTTYVASPLPYSVDSIARGASLYQDHCSTCHGAHGHGDGPAAPGLPIKAVDLAQHASNHRTGDLFWWIAHGIPATPMPAFDGELGDTEIWALVAFLRAQSDAESISTAAGGAELPSPIVAPDFTFELADHAQQSLRQPSGTTATLLVLYALPESLPRLSALAVHERAYAAAGARVIAVARDKAVETINDRAPIMAIAGANVGTTYAMYARRAGEAGTGLAHAEFLIDRQGYMRARWIGVASAATDGTSELLSRIEALASEPPRAPPAEGHAH
jgi:putative copper export protein/mono/diheme cytochrome c family protein